MKITTLSSHDTADLPSYVPRVSYDEPSKSATINISATVFFTIDSAAAAGQLEQWAREAGQKIRAAQP